MRIAVIGGGFCGLVAAHELTKHGSTVTIFERDSHLGGLAHGFRAKDWKWSLEYAYHHLFTNDHAILALIRELGIEKKLLLTRPITASYYNRKIYQLDSPWHLLTFPELPLIDKIRTGALLAYCKLTPWWKPLEKITAEHFFSSYGGKKSWKALWEPLMVGKFGPYAKEVAASWLWARIKKRTPNLYYIGGGFETLIAALEKAIEKRGGEIRTNTAVFSIRQVADQFELGYSQKSRKHTHGTAVFDKVLLTVPTPIVTQLVPQLQAKPIPHLHAQTLILETDKPILDNIYWLNMTDRSFPFLAVVAHTNMVDKKYYSGHHLTYFGNYLPSDHRYLAMTKQQLLKEFKPFISRLSLHASYKILNTYLFTGPFAQPVHTRNYSKRAPRLLTPISGLYLANIDSIYPWDRGTNYAVALGHDAAAHMLKDR